MKKPELLIPASSLEVLKTAVIYGADAVYIGGEAFSLRAKAKNFSAEEMKEGIRFAHAHGVRVHVTANILAHNSDLEGAEAYFQELRELRPDAILVADPGMFMLAKDICPEIDIHISTQANNTNYETFRFWHDLGAKRVVAARELSLRELKEIREKIPSDLELECFVHGAMCISYSGRCLLSAYMTGRNANLGACTHPCRWRHRLYEEE
ncbi:MAG: U32 family peptidase, partial [Lachnospiraceae bacterium]|nr:U32 family peptidase [Lachnospiraceae bacterium]